MTCRVPTGPLAPSAPQTPEKGSGDNEKDKETDISILGSGEPAYTPLTFALQGTLQRSHLHIWTDMNVLVHNIASGSRSGSAKKNKRKSKKSAPGYVVAGTAYSIPEFDAAHLFGNQKSSSSDGEKEEKAEVAVSEAAREPWTAGHGTKVIRGEPLTFTFHVSWVEGGSGIRWPSSPSSSSDKGSSTVGAFFSRLFFFILAASAGAMAALHWERRRRAGWRGDGILGVPPTSSPFSSSARGNGPTGIVYGNGGRMNGYGGFSSASNSSGYAIGKSD